MKEKEETTPANTKNSLLRFKSQLNKVKGKGGKEKHA
jgi:hypothetical protein